MITEIPSAVILLLLLSSCTPLRICNILCDNANNSYNNSRKAANYSENSTSLSLYILDEYNMAFGSLENSVQGDLIWLERSFDGGVSSAEGPQGKTNSASTHLFNIDDPSALRIGAVRICGALQAFSMESACTPWVRSTVNADRPIDAAATALMQMYMDNGLWKGWWNSANALVSIIQYTKITEKDTYKFAIEKTFEKNKNRNFTNFYVDDTLWWGLAWIEAYDLLKEEKYLRMAEFDVNYAEKFVDDTCGGGIWWTADKTYKNAITIELFIKLTASLHNRIPDDRKYLKLSLGAWNWFKNSGMINEINLINDGLLLDCKNNRGIMWSYNQGVILGALVQIHNATGDESYLVEGQKIADAVLNSSLLNPDGVLKDYGCEGVNLECDADQSSFKGIFIRNLGELDRVLVGRPYRNWIKAQADSNFNNNRNSLDQYGIHWDGPFDRADAARQHSALDSFLAAYTN